MIVVTAFATLGYPFAVMTEAGNTDQFNIKHGSPLNDRQKHNFAMLFIQFACRLHYWQVGFRESTQNSHPG